MAKNKWLSWVIVVIWMTVIFCLSHQPAAESKQLSTGITEIIIQIFERIAPNMELDISDLNHVVRKSAHFFAYLILGILILKALMASGNIGYRSIALAFGKCVIYAISDEFHQLFIPGRSGEVRDVFIDTTGASVGIFMYMVVVKVAKWASRERSKMHKKKNR